MSSDENEIAPEKLEHMVHKAVRNWHVRRLPSRYQGLSAETLLVESDGVRIDDIRVLTEDDLKQLKADGAIIELGDTITGEMTDDGEVGATLGDLDNDNHTHPHPQVQDRTWVDNLLPQAIRIDVQVNLDELMPAWIKAHGERKARQMRRLEILGAAVGHYWSASIEKVGEIFHRIVGH